MSTQTQSQREGALPRLLSLEKELAMKRRTESYLEPHVAQWLGYWVVMRNHFPREGKPSLRYQCVPYWKDGDYPTAEWHDYQLAIADLITRTWPNGLPVSAYGEALEKLGYTAEDFCSLPDEAEQVAPEHESHGRWNTQ